MLKNRLQDSIGASIRTLLSGSPSKKFIPDPDRPGLIPSGGAAFLIHAEASMMIGGIRALLLQSLHPLAMYAVSEHSDFRSDPLARLRRTVFFLGTTTYGSVEQAEAAIEEVRRIHTEVEGVTPDGVPYRASDARLLSWVHCTEVDSFLTAYQIYGRRRRQADADAYIAEMSVIAEALGDPDPPRSAAELRETLVGFIPDLAGSALSRESTQFLRDFPFRRGARFCYVLLFAAAVGCLPDWAARLHGFRRRKFSRLLTTQAARVLVRVMSWALEGADDASTNPRDKLAVSAHVA